jgi:hypothetical protein
VRRVFGHDRHGAHRDAYVFTTDTALAPPALISRCPARQTIATTFPAEPQFRGQRV